MTESELKFVEAELSISLPKAYRDVTCPFPVRAYRGNSDSDLWDDAKAIIQLNREVHENEGWPSNLFALGRNDGGDSNALDLDSKKYEVHWIDRHINAVGTGPTGQSFADWANELFESMRSSEYMDGFDPETDPPGTRSQNQRITAKEFMGCLGAIVAIAVVGALIIFGVSVLLGY